ncbi:MAG: hypothetical protein JNJ77_19075 [Planctomycetia bacterium]|nr:hypothetical protein [Planctomycetia bacterium]
MYLNASILSLSILFTTLVPVLAQKDSLPLEWKALLIIKSKGNIKAAGFPDVNYQLKPADIAAVKQAFTGFTADFVETLSAGKAVWKPTVVESKLPLMSVSRIGDGTWVAPVNVADDIREYAKMGEYDNIFIYWKDSDDQTRKTVRGGFGWSIGPTQEANGCGFSCVNYCTPEQLSRDSEFTEVFIHEWLHQLEAFYGNRGVKLPKGGLHGNDNYGFKHQNGWKHWYKAFLTASLSDKSGLGSQAWQLGSIRSEMTYHLPGYMTAARRRQNLLRNGSFEIGQGAGWNPRSWLKANQNVSAQNKVARDGKNALMLRSPVSDDLMAYQTVRVKPFTRYLLAGWIKTDQVIVTDKDRKVGANLSVWGGFDSSQSLVGNHDWTYASLVFDSRDKQLVEVGARLGHHSSVTMGTAWFDDLVLLELPAYSRAAPVK